jgi:hypothetical protein
MSEESKKDFNLEALRLPQTYQDIAVKKRLTHVPLRKPGKFDFVRVHPEYFFETATIAPDDDSGIFVVDRRLWDAVSGVAAPVRFLLTITRQRALTLWPIRLTGPDGKSNSWHEAAREAADRAKTCWVSIRANMQTRCYDVFEAAGNLGEPEWPEESFETILQIAFKDRVIDDYGHPALRQLRGEI